VSKGSPRGKMERNKEDFENFCQFVCEYREEMTKILVLQNGGVVVTGIISCVEKLKPAVIKALEKARKEYLMGYSYQGNKIAFWRTGEEGTFDPYTEEGIMDFRDPPDEDFLDEVQRALSQSQFIEVIVDHLEGYSIPDKLTIKVGNTPGEPPFIKNKEVWMVSVSPKGVIYNLDTPFIGDLRGDLNSASLKFLESYSPPWVDFFVDTVEVSIPECPSAMLFEMAGKTARIFMGC